jgi:uncharacterized protein YkwD
MSTLAFALFVLVFGATTVPLKEDVRIFGLLEHHHRAASASPPPSKISDNCGVAREQRMAEVRWMLGDLNRLRAGAHAPPLAIDGRLCTIAVRFADDLVARATIGHISSSGQSPFDRMRAAGIAMRAAGENVARAPDAVAGDSMLYADPPHRRNMLDGRFRHVGLAAVSDRNGAKVFVQDFTD